MGDIKTLIADLEAARAELLAALEGISPEDFARTLSGGDHQSVRDALWRTGLVEDWVRRAVSLGTAGKRPAAFHPFARPDIADDLAYHVAWLEQCHRPTLALLRRLSEDELDRAFVLPEGPLSGQQTARALLRHVADQDRGLAERVRAASGAASVS